MNVAIQLTMNMKDVDVEQGQTRKLRYRPTILREMWRHGEGEQARVCEHEGVYYPIYGGDDDVSDRPLIQCRCVECDQL